MTKAIWSSTAFGVSMPDNPLKHVTWQTQNCLSCKWFRPSDVLNADILTNGLCVHPDLKKYELVVTGRDWCNLFDEVTQRQIDAMQERAAKG